MDFTDSTPAPAAEAGPPTPIQRRAWRRHATRKALTLVTWGLVLATGLLVLQHQHSRAGAREAVRRPAHGLAPAGVDARLHREAEAPAAAPVLAAQVGAGACVDALAPCEPIERGMPLKPSVAMPGPEAPLSDAVAAPRVPAPREAPPLHIDPAEPGAPAPSQECRQVAEEILSITAALKDAVDPAVREQLQRRGREADNRQFFLHCVS